MSAHDDGFLAEIEASAEVLSLSRQRGSVASNLGIATLDGYLQQYPLHPCRSIREHYDGFVQWARGQHLLPGSLARFSALLMRRTIVLETTQPEQLADCASD
jgi:hypothetical protein